MRTMNRGQAKTLIFTKQPFIEDEGHRKIEKWQFSAMSDTEIVNMAETQIYKCNYYDPNQKPIEGGLLDPRLGPANKSSGECATCGAVMKDCPGHFGFLVLALPVLNVGYLSTIVDILKCICKLCSGILLEEGMRNDFLKKMRSPKMEPLRKTELMKKIVKKCNSLATNYRPVKCSKCGFINGSVKKAVGVLGIIHDRSKLNGVMDDFRTTLSHTKESKASFNVATHMLNPARIYSLFKRMVDEDCELLNLSNRPANLIMKNIAVPPIAIRPSVIVDRSLSNENDITERLKRIIQSNAILRRDLLEAKSAPKCLGHSRRCILFEDVLGFFMGCLVGMEQASWDILQVEVAQYINSDIRGVPFSMQTAKPLSGFVQRLKGKGGRFRGNLSGKRVEYTGRTVISPDPNLKITEVGIPIKMAQILTYPERVSHHNIEKLRQCVSNGPDKYPGARMLRNPDGTEWSLKVNRKNAADGLKYGDIVERHLEDGDIVLFNRQPSLHRMSIMCHRAKVMPWRTLRFNESVCNPYNADFDGDEMNMHVPQTEEARTEAVMLMGVQNNLCTPKNGEVLVASTQDFLTSSFLITRKDTFYDRASFSLMCSYMGDGTDPVDLPTPAVIKPIELWTGKQLFSVLVRPNSNVRVYLNFTVNEKSYSKTEDGGPEAMCPNDGFVYFRNSELIAGQLGKGTLDRFMVLVPGHMKYQPGKVAYLWQNRNLPYEHGHSSVVGSYQGHLQKKMWAAVTKGSAECIYLEDAHRSVVGSSQGHFQKFCICITLGNGNKDGLYSVLLRDYKAHAAASCMNRLAKLSARWIGNHGFSIGISDVQPSDNLYNEKEKIIKEGYNKCAGMIQLYNEGQLPLEPGCDAAQSLESGITKILNNIRDQTGKLCMQTLHWRNSPLIMSQCGSKGSPINISQMIACVGQQSVGGRRAPNGFIDRSLPHFPRKAKTPAVDELWDRVKVLGSFMGIYFG
ncbi:unnamed protein product [Prunus armeniaca]|uniref:DNA-directed RNA polymerase subunit n=1 Tax=Prunus armeniaca TaxID=36596 RepID=A0A6J5V9N6_PRUAR|nr:unnamed protein product [Prunus armeniaca]